MISRKPLCLCLIIIVSLLILVLGRHITAQAFYQTILECPGEGTGGDRADMRGIRFSLDRDFSAIEIRMDASIQGIYTFDAEIRRSTGFIEDPEQVISDISVELPGETSNPPYTPILIEFNNVPVSGTETFTLRFTNISGPGTLYFEVFGIGNEPCDDIEETHENNVANPTVRGDPAGFKVLGGFAISSSYTGTPPKIDGVIGFGEWPLSNKIEFDNGFITVVNDRIRLYILVDLLEDTGNDVSEPVDYFWLSFDVDMDGAITPEVDINYGTSPSTGNMRYQYYLGPGVWTGIQPDTFSSKARGFGCFFADGSFKISFFPFSLNCNSHRVWEFGIDLEEIGATPGGSTRMGLRVHSPNPSFTEDIPENFFTDFSNLIEVDLAPPISFIIAPSPLASIGFETNPIEITQAIQTRTNSMPLVADKTTVARVYADTSGIFVLFSQPCKMSLYGSKDGIDLPGSPLASFHYAPLTINREDLNDTANFLLPKTWDDSSVQFKAVVRDLKGNQSSTSNISLSFTPKETLTYWIVPINTGTEASPILPDNSDISDQESYLKVVYPVPTVNFIRKSWEVIGPTTISDTIDKLNEYHSQVVLAWIFGLIFTGEPPFDLPDQIYGFTPSGGGISDPVWVGGNGYVARGFFGSSREGTMAHEINHNLDRDTSGTWGRHTPYDCGAAGPDPAWPYTTDDIQEVGFDTRLPWSDGSDGRHTAVPSNYPDLMSYCKSGELPTKWISPYRWENLFNNFATVAKSGIESKTEVLMQEIQTVFYISGQVNINQTGKLNPVLVEPGIPTGNIMKGDYAIEFLNAMGRLLDRFPFFISFVDVEGNKRETVGFNFQLPFVEGTSRIQLKLGNVVLDQIQVSKNVPSVSVLVPNGGEEWWGKQTIKWSARDLDGDPLSFSIMYSSDGGKTWIPVASKVRNLFYEVDTSKLPGSKEAKIRIIATDGFNTAQDDSDRPFAVVPNPPTVNILQPGDGEIHPTGKMIHFVGIATDPEDETIPEESYVWSYGETVFGTGSEVEAILPEGIHIITLTVIDSDGNGAKDNITLQIAKPCEGDFDHDGDVDGSDLAVFAADFGRTDCANKPPCEGDFGNDGDVDGSDLAVFAADFGRTDCPTNSQ